MTGVDPRVRRVLPFVWAPSSEIHFPFRAEGAKRLFVTWKPARILRSHLRTWPHPAKFLIPPPSPDSSLKEIVPTEIIRISATYPDRVPHSSCLFCLLHWKTLLGEEGVRNTSLMSTMCRNGTGMARANFLRVSWPRMENRISHWDTFGWKKKKNKFLRTLHNE